MTKNQVLTVVAAALTVLGLAACTDAPPASIVTPSPSATPNPTPTPTPTLTAITIAGGSLVATDQNGAVLAELVYKGPDPATIATLTALFGFEPTVTETPRETNTDAFGGTIYDWEGFSIRWLGRWGDEVSPGYSKIYVASSTASVRGIAVATAGGLAVGDPGDLTTQFPESSATFTMSDGGILTNAWIDCIPMDVPNIPDAADCVRLTATPSDASITLLFAPYEFAYGL